MNHLRLREEVKDGNRRMARLVCRSLFPQVRSLIFSLNKLFGSIAFHVLACTTTLTASRCRACDGRRVVEEEERLCPDREVWRYRRMRGDPCPPLSWMRAVAVKFGASRNSAEPITDVTQQ